MKIQRFFCTTTLCHSNTNIRRMKYSRKLINLRTWGQGSPTAAWRALKEDRYKTKQQPPGIHAVRYDRLRRRALLLFDPKFEFLNGGGMPA